MLMAIIMKAICIRVDSAMIFFRSVSYRAEILAVSEVKVANVISVYRVVGCRWSDRRIISITPAVTRVDECTRADTGVGAAMAAGSQAVKGNCALLVILAVNSNSITR